MRRYEVSQKSDEWLALRAGIATASEADSILTPKEMKRSASSKTGGSYYCRKLAEKWMGMPLPDKGSSKAMDNGTVLEDHAIPKFELETGLDVERVGFITTDSRKFGCSPDAVIVGGMGGAEIKCPEIQTHIGWLLDGELPPEHRGQVQASMLVTGASYWWFMSYCRGLPELIVQVPRDEKYLGIFQKALEEFNADLDAGYAKLLKLNGGIEPVRPKPQPKEDLIGQHYANTEEGFAKWLESDYFNRIGTP